MKAILDVDGILWDFHRPLFNKLSKRFSGLPKSLPAEWNWFRKYMTDQEFYDCVFDTHVEQVGYSVFPGTDLLLHVLDEKNIEVMIASNRDSALIYNLSRWLYTNRVAPISGIYAGYDKSFLIERGDLLIDDNPGTIRYASSIRAASLTLKWPWNNEVKDLPYVARFDSLYFMAKWVDENVPNNK